MSGRMWYWPIRFLMIGWVWSDQIWLAVLVTDCEHASLKNKIPIGAQTYTTSPFTSKGKAHFRTNTKMSWHNPNCSNLIENGAFKDEPMTRSEELKQASVLKQSVNHEPNNYIYNMNKYCTTDCQNRGFWCVGPDKHPPYRINSLHS